MTNSTIPPQMRAITCSSFGDADCMRWEELPTPSAKPGEVLIRVAATGLNRADLLQRQGKYQSPDGNPLMGMEVSGEIVALGPGTTRWAVGDKVCALLSGGGYAEYVAVHEGQCLPIPANLSFIEAAALPETIVTVWANLFEDGGLRPGDTALVHGGGSGIGTMAIQIAKIMGAKIFVTVGSDDKAEACIRLGADLAINHKTEDFVAAIERARGGQGVNVVLDMIGGEYLNRNLAVLAPHGRHISIATQQGRLSQVDLRLVMTKRLTLTGSTLRSRSREEKVRLVGEIEKKLWNFVAAGRIKPLIYCSYPLKNASEAHKVMESGAHFGKIVLEVRS